LAPFFLTQKSCFFGAGGEPLEPLLSREGGRDRCFSVEIFREEKRGKRFLRGGEDARLKTPLKIEKPF
jgi:hypothetical protein